MVVLAPVDLCLDDYADCWSGGCVTERNWKNDAILVNSNSSSFVGIDVTFTRSCRAYNSTSSAGPWSDPKCSATSCLNDGVCQQSWNGYKYVWIVLSFLSLLFYFLCEEIRLLILHRTHLLFSCLWRMKNTGIGELVQGRNRLTLSLKRPVMDEERMTWMRLVGGLSGMGRFFELHSVLSYCWLADSDRISICH